MIDKYNRLVDIFLSKMCIYLEDYKYPVFNLITMALSWDKKRILWEKERKSKERSNASKLILSDISKIALCVIVCYFLWKNNFITEDTPNESLFWYALIIVSLAGCLFISRFIFISFINGVRIESHTYLSETIIKKFYYLEYVELNSNCNVYLLDVLVNLVFIIILLITGSFTLSKGLLYWSFLSTFILLLPNFNLLKINIKNIQIIRFIQILSLLSLITNVVLNIMEIMTGIENSILIIISTAILYFGFRNK